MTTGRADERGLVKRGNRWWLRIYVKGQGKRMIALKPEGDTHATTNKDVARFLAREIRREIEDTRKIERRAAAADLPALIDQFRALNAIEASPATARDNASRVWAFIDPEGKRHRMTIKFPPGVKFPAGIFHPGEITGERVQAYFVALRKAKRSPKTLKNWLGALSRFCEMLIDRGHLTGNPCRRVKLPKTEDKLPRFLAPAEYDQALDLARQHGIYAEVAVALLTGMRRGELGRMKWADVDLERGVVLVPKAKSGRPRAIPISEKLRDVLAAQRAATGTRKHVFPGRERRDQSGARRRSWWVDAIRPLQEAMPAAFTDGMADTATGRGWHLFRHTFASRLVQAGVPIAKVSAWLGHADIRMTMIYAHLAPGHDRDINKA